LNTSLLLLSEIPFVLVFTHFIGEKTTVLKLMGAGSVLVGAVLLLYHGGRGFSLGDLLVVLSTATYPVGNFYAKKAFHVVSPTIVLLVRLMLGSAFIGALSFVFERHVGGGMSVSGVWSLIAFNGIMLIGIAKIIWYEGMKRLDISKAIALGMTFPFFSVLYLLLFFKEQINLLQWTGITIMAVGVFFSAKRQSVDPQLTKYAANA
jgi:drug/metabolite transporter (DMT)-like permease